MPEIAGSSVKIRKKPFFDIIEDMFGFMSKEKNYIRLKNANFLLKEFFGANLFCFFIHVACIFTFDAICYVHIIQRIDIKYAK